MFLRPPSPQTPLHYLSGARKWPLWASRQNLQETFVGAGSSEISGGEISSSCLTWADVSPKEQAQTLGLPDSGPPWAAYGPCPLMHSTGTVCFILPTTGDLQGDCTMGQVGLRWGADRGLC